MTNGIVRTSTSTYYVDQHNGKTESYTSYVTGANFAAKEWIASHESGGSYTARNGVCYGRYQLNANYYLNGNYSVVNQEKAADAYVTGRYGSWANAKAFWLKHNWY
ncbi:aggregation-promoting factor C-terminal-like domain-containing protein [Paucilactobacillus wasatchensis]